ncbi:MAG: leucyl/phenylalanyl-tRNA--protein transferase [Actinobacteria bacterium]|nr:leucyl/phenylalanyl-tRNA--protein transferase [Actinomycetota bacterium]MCB9412238.1 leucyl/phenylalanyl-tRNA--protein transferase [Actinomycetota bacterium]
MPGVILPRQDVPADVTRATEVVAVGGEISAASIVAAYSRGEFPMEVEVAPNLWVPAWYSPEERAVLRPGAIRVSRSLRRSMRRFTLSYDRDFAAVLEGCADPAREHGWITDDYRAAYLELATAGYAHSVEVWQAGELVGGLLGVQLGGLFCADSKFRRVTDASKAAVAGLADWMFSGASGNARLIDAQWLTDHLSSLGFAAMPRTRYLSALPGLLRVPAAFPGPPRDPGGQ